MIPVLSRKSLLFLLLGVFGLLFGFAGEVFAIPSVTTPRNDNTPTWTWSAFTDTGGSGLAGYIVQWCSGGAFPSSCDANTATTSVNSFTFPSSLADGTWHFRVKSIDNAGNESAWSEAGSGTIDTVAPALAEITAVSSPTNDTTPDYIFSSNESGTITYGGDCSSSTTAATQNNNNAIIFDALAAGTHSNCTIIVTDAAGNQSVALAVSSFTIIIDIIAPTVTSFTINGTPCSGSPCTATITARSAITIAWSATDTGGSLLKHSELWIGTDTTNDGTSAPTSWSEVDGDPNTDGIQHATSSFSHNPADGTYWYGIHAIDNASNCIMEDGGHCGGVGSDSYDFAPLGPRIVRGPIKVIVDKIAPAAVSIVLSDATSSSVKVSWTAPGDDGSNGTAASYDLRYSTSAITSSNFDSATAVTGEPTPSVAGTTESMSVTGLSASTTYYFALKTSDEVPNTSAISNVPNLATTAAVVVNTAPTVSDIANQTINEDANTGALPFTIGDVETAVANLTLTGSSSNTTLVPAASIVFGGSGASRTVTITPAPNQSGTSTITVTVSDGALTANDTFVLTVTAVDDAPAAVNDSYSVLEEDILTVAVPGVLGNDTDIDSSSLLAVLVSGPSNGTLTLNANGSFTYDPNANYNGADSFTYKANDGTANSNTATVTIAVADGTAPIVRIFFAKGPCSGDACNSPFTVYSAFDITVTVSDVGGSHLKSVAILRAEFTSGDGKCHNTDKSGCLWSSLPNVVLDKTQGSDFWNAKATDNPANGTYWYGIHAVDNTLNCITENTGEAGKGHCGGVASDRFDDTNARRDRGPIKVVMLHDANVPSVTINKATGQADPTNASPINFTAVFSEPVYNFTYTDVTIGGTAGGTKTITVTGSGTTYNVAVSGMTSSGMVTATIPANGAIDAAGNRNTASNTATATYDISKPKIHVFDVVPKTPAWVNASTANVKVSFEVSDVGEAGIKDVEIWRYDPDNNTPPNNAVGWGIIQTITASSLALKSGSATNYEGSYNDTVSNLQDGKTYQYGIHANDNAGNMCHENDSPCGDTTQNKTPKDATDQVVTLSVQVDKTVSGTPGTPTTTTPTTDTTPAWTWTASTGSPTSYTVYWDTTAGGTTNSASVTANSFTHTTVLAEGTWYVKVKAFDAAGNASALSGNGSVVIDTQAPVVSTFIIDPESPAWTNSSVSVSWIRQGPRTGITEESGGSGLKQIEVWRAWDTTGNGLQSGEWDDSSPDFGTQTNPIYTKNSSFSSSTSDDGSYTDITDTLTTGVYWYGLHAKDKAGNIGYEPSSKKALVDKDKPTSQIQSPSAGSFQEKDFAVAVADVDTGGSTLNTNGCKYAVTDIGIVGSASASGTSTTLIDVNRNEPEGFWTGGLLKMTSGLNENQSKRVSNFTVLSHTIQVSSAFQYPIALNDSYTIYRNSNIALSDTSRTCGANSPLIPVGSQSTKVCSTEGMNICQVIMKSNDNAGNSNSISETAKSLRRFSIDFTPPIVGPISCSTNLSEPCITVQQGSSTAIKSLVSDNVQVANCNLQWKTPSQPGTWQDITLGSSNFTTIPISLCPLGRGSNCLEISKDTVFSEAGTYRMRAQCSDAFATVIGDETVISADTLSVVLGVVPSYGSVNTLFDLVADTAGSTMSGDTTYGFDCRIDTGDCTADGNFADCDFSITTNATTYTANNLCQYPVTAGTYTAKVAVQRGAGTAEDTASIGPITTNSVHTTTNRSVDAANPTDYCGSGAIGFPPVRVRWAFSDDDGDPQGAYEIKVFKDEVEMFTTGKNLDPTDSVRSYMFQASGEQLLWNTTYTWQVRVWDSPNDDVSSFVSGPQFTTSAHHYPIPEFTKTPALPGAQESVQFTDQTNFDAGGVNNSQPSINRSWSWTFGDGGSSTLQNPVHTYAQTGAFGVTLQSGDNVGSCSNSQTVNVSVPFPEWQEISPF